MWLVIIATDVVRIPAITWLERVFTHFTSLDEAL